jgi:ligand-binding SRPBCC domain-containing protein
VPSFRIVTDIDAPVERCFDLSRSIDLHLESMIASGERAVAGVTAGLIGAGQEVSWEARHFGVHWRMTSRITAFDPPHRFVDEMVRGPFRSFRHEHLFERAGAGTRMTDVVAFRMSLGPVADLPVGLYLRRLLRIRGAAIRSAAVTFGDGHSRG